MASQVAGSERMGGEWILARDSSWSSDLTHEEGNNVSRLGNNERSRGSGAGPSGWHYEHLRVLMGNVITNDLLYLMSSLIAEGKVPSSVLPLLTAARLIALPKSNADIRPIAIAWRGDTKSHSKSCLQMSTTFSSYFHPIQHGLATPGGAELLVQQWRIQRGSMEPFLDQNPMIGGLLQLLPTQYVLQC